MQTNQVNNKVKGKKKCDLCKKNIAGLKKSGKYASSVIQCSKHNMDGNEGKKISQKEEKRDKNRYGYNDI